MNFKPFNASCCSSTVNSTRVSESKESSNQSLQTGFFTGRVEMLKSPTVAIVLFELVDALCVLHLCHLQRRGITFRCRRMMIQGQKRNTQHN